MKTINSDTSLCCPSSRIAKGFSFFTIQKFQIMTNLKIIPALLLAAALFASSCSSTIYIVRHAEKAGNTGDPDLSPAGMARAQQLATLMADKNISEIYSTETNRTLQTAQPTGTALSVAVQRYSNDTLESFVNKRLKPLGKNRLVVGHSNTILSITQLLGTTPTLTAIPENDYDNLLIVKRKRCWGKLKVTLTETTYGAASP